MFNTPTLLYSQPPLPEEDYPPEDYPGAKQLDPYEDFNATGPSTHPKEYAFTHVSRTLIPRANLDRTTPPGWNLTVEPNGTWVFTHENSPDQVHKSSKTQDSKTRNVDYFSCAQWTISLSTLQILFSIQWVVRLIAESLFSLHSEVFVTVFTWIQYYRENGFLPPLFL